MKRRRTLALAGVLAALTTTAFHLLIQPSDDWQAPVLRAPGDAANPPTQTAQTTTNEGTPPQVNGIRSGVRSAAETGAAYAPSPEAHHKLETLLRQFNESRSTRQFIAAALKDARHGGVIYALAAGEPCDAFHASRELGRSPATSNRAPHAAALLEARCDIGSDEALQQVSTALATHAADLGAEPLFAMLVPGPGGKSRDQSLRQARALLNSGDPIAMESLVHLDFHDPLGATPYFDGRHYRSAAERELMKDAWLLVQCRLGVACGPDATQTLLLCATRDWCGPSVAEAMEIGRGPGGTFTQVQFLTESLLRAIRTKRTAAFVPAS